MNDINWWLMALAFAAGLVITAVLMIRRVKREVPVYAALGRGPGVGATAASTATAASVGAGTSTEESEKTVTLPPVDAEPYGPGSLRVAATAEAPNVGYSVKGNEDSMLYHTPDSPSYKQTIAEIWFKDEDSAQRAGFSRWDSAAGAAAVTSVVGLGAVGGAAASNRAESTIREAPAVVDEPYGADSLRVAATATAPTGYSVKGNEDSMLYHTADSPSYKQTIAEIWFRDVEAAEKAGFARWDSGKSQRGKK